MNPTPSKKELMNRSLSTITINIGKSGVKESVIDEIKRQLKDREVVKIRFSKAISLDNKNILTILWKKPILNWLILEVTLLYYLRKKR